MKLRPRLLVVAVGVFALAAAVGGSTWAAFSSQEQNQGNNIAAAATFANMPVASGTYTGDAVDNRQIALPFQADVLIVKNNANQAAVVRTSTMAGDATKPLTGATALTANLLQSLTATGFTVGTDARVNGNGATYTWTAFKASAVNLRVGSYTGDGTASRAIGGVGFSSEYAIVLSAGAGAAHHKMAGMTAGFNFDASVGIANGLIGNHADGFQVGNSAQVNAAGTTYHYIAWAKRAGGMATASYTGNNTNGATVTGMGFSPQYAIVRANDTVTARQGNQRPLSLTGTASQFFGATANPTTGITALDADGLTLGTDASVNAAGVSYFYAAFRHTGNGCVAPGGRTVSAVADTWVDQANPTTNFGTVATMNVLSKSPNANGRTLIRYTLPPLPAGCAVTDARLRIRDATPAGGRTLQAFRTTTAFSETTTNWNNQPPTTGAAATVASPAAAGWLEWDVTSQVQATYPGTDSAYVIRDATENASAAGVQQILESRTAGTVGNRPQLVVTYG